MFFLTTDSAFSFFKLPVEKLLGKSVVGHSDHMTGPSYLRLEEGLGADLPGAFKDLSIRDLLYRCIDVCCKEIFL